MKTTDPDTIIWRKPSGVPVACLEKIKVLNENHAELRQTVQDIMEDALLMGCSEAQIRAAMHALIDEVVPAFGEQAD
jgi:hypothetical protein